MSSPTTDTRKHYRLWRGGHVIKKKLHDRVHVVPMDVDVRYMWIRIKRVDLKELYTAICYFPFAYSRFVSLEESSYLPFYEDILSLASIEVIILVGDVVMKRWVQG